MVILRFLDLYIRSSLHVALSACALVAITAFNFGIYCHYALYGFVFCSVVSSYNTIKYFEGSMPKVTLFITALAYLAAIYLATLMPYKTLLVTAFVSAMGLIYIMPLYPLKCGLRQYGVIKVLIVSICWSIYTVVIPMIEGGFEGYIFTTKGIIYIFSRFLFVLVLILPFEIGDMNRDDTKWKTIPQKIGRKGTTYLGYLLLVVFVALSPIDIVNTFTALVVCFALYFSSPRQSFYYARLWVEGIPIMQLALTLIWKGL